MTRNLFGRFNCEKKKKKMHFLANIYIIDKSKNSS